MTYGICFLEVEDSMEDMGMGQKEERDGMIRKVRKTCRTCWTGDTYRSSSQTWWKDERKEKRDFEESARMKIKSFSKSRGIKSLA